ncbi:MAG: Trk family potassium uptake protein [Solobacterium sp.]|nr:Trk family potassium uptake protein [Solobacterium sp.]
MRKLRVLIQDLLTSFRTILLGFLVLIAVGALLLSLPIAVRDGEPVPFINALFTAASAACVTGLVTYDTALKWSLFGKCVILLLIQIGGLGVVTAAVSAMLAAGKRIGLMSRITMQDAVSAPQVGGIIRFTQFFIKGTLLFEGIGAILLYPVFLKDFGPLRGLGYAVFHSISAFCNAGFDLMGIDGPFSSLTRYAGNVWVNAVIMFLIIIGGIGFLTWEDLCSTRFRFRPLRLQTKLILVGTVVLIVVPFLYLVLLEFRHLPLQERILLSLFQAVTPRTAGFNTADYGSMSENGLLLTILLMLTGGAPGSTAGGMKITTIAVISISANTFLNRREYINAFGRRIADDTVHNAMSLLTLYISLMIGGTFVIAAIEQLPVLPVMFECASALGTVGLSTGITPGLSEVSKLILISFMYFGRVGALTLAYAMASNDRKDSRKMPLERITVG